MSIEEDHDHPFKTKSSMKRRRNRGFKLGLKLKKMFKWAITIPISRRRSYQYQPIHPPVPLTPSSTPMSTLHHWGRSIKRRLCFTLGMPKYIRMGTQEDHHHPHHRHPINPAVPRGHLAVYVGEKEDHAQRFLVPVMYFNHPLFGDLLKHTENKFGYDFPGGIQIPCPVSHFQKVQTTIASSTRSFSCFHRR